MAPETIKIGRRVYKILFPDLLRPLTADERSSLKTSIRKYGIRQGVVVDEDDGVIDGINRLTIASELKLTEVPCERVQWAGMSLEEKRELAAQLNDARRHLKPHERAALAAQMEDRRKRVQVANEKRSEAKTHLQIAQELGVSETQIREDLKLPVPHPCGTGAPAKVKGRDGKMYPTNKTRKPKEKPPSPPPAVVAADSKDDEDGPTDNVTFMTIRHSEDEAANARDYEQAAKLQAEAKALEVAWKRGETPTRETIRKSAQQVRDDELVNEINALPDDRRRAIKDRIRP